MSNHNIMIFHYVEPEVSKPKKKIPNMFFAYRKEMMRYKPRNLSMTEYSKLVSKWWRDLSENEKVELQRRYQISRDFRLQTVVSESCPQPSMTDGENLTNYPVPKEQWQRIDDGLLDEIDTDRYQKPYIAMKQDHYLPSAGFLNN